MSTAFVYGLYSASGEDEGDSFLEFGHVNALFLEIRVLSRKACRIKLGSTSPVGVAPTDFRTLFADWTNFRHMGLKTSML